MHILLTVLCIIISYFSGCFNAGYLYSKYIKHDDVRRHGSGNAGTTNVLRTYGKGPAAAVLVLDALKGYAAVWLTIALTKSETAAMLAAFAVVAGHNWPVTMGFHGGKGVATSLGVVLALNFTAGLIAFGAALLVMALTRIVSIGSLCGFLTALAMMFVYREPTLYIVTIGVLSLLTLVQHLANIRRIINGTESKLGQKK